MTPTEIIRDAIDGRFATPTSRSSRFAAMQVARGVVAALRGAGYIIVVKDAIAMAQREAVAIEREIAIGRDSAAQTIKNAGF